jgi:hypothetical protein
MNEDGWLEGAYEERYEGEDYNLWEEQQVWNDREYEDYQDEGFFGSGEA